MHGVDSGEVAVPLPVWESVDIGPVLKPVDHLVTRGGSAVGCGDDPVGVDNRRPAPRYLGDVAGGFDPGVVAPNDLAMGGTVGR